MKEAKKERRKATSCGGVVWRARDGKVEVLLIQQFPNKPRWGIPKGHVNKREPFEECAVREIREETGVDVVLEEQLQDVVVSYKDEDKTVKSWLARCVGDDTPQHDGPDSEVADARWFDVAQLPEIHVYQRPLIAAAVSRVFEIMSNGHVERPT